MRAAGWVEGPPQAETPRLGDGDALRGDGAGELDVFGPVDDADVGAAKVILGFDIFRRDIKVCGIDKSRGSALRESCIY